MDALVVTGIWKKEAISASVGRHDVAATWPSVNGPDSLNRLTVHIQMRDATRDREMLEVVRSVRFRAR